PMRIRPLLCFLALACLNSGCSFFCYSTRNLIEAPWKKLNHYCELHQFSVLASNAWRQISLANPQQDYSEDYVAGFLDGYVDFLDADGLGEPPAAPPDRYQSARYHTPQGLRAIDDWFAGFRHGAAAAQASGQRELVVLPMALPPRRVDVTARTGQNRTEF